MIAFWDCSEKKMRRKSENKLDCEVESCSLFTSRDRFWTVPIMKVRHRDGCRAVLHTGSAALGWVGHGTVAPSLKREEWVTVSLTLAIK